MTHLPTMCQLSTQGIKKIRLPLFPGFPLFCQPPVLYNNSQIPPSCYFLETSPPFSFALKAFKKSDTPPPFYHWGSPHFCQPLIFYKYPFLLLFRDLFSRKQESPLESTLDSKYQSKTAVSHAVNIFQANNQKKYM